MSAPPDDYMVELDNLRNLLGKLLKREYLEQLVAMKELLDRSYVERYVDLCDKSEHGGSCGWAAKAKDLFIQLQEQEIAKKIQYIFETFIKEK